jgi:DNA-binding MarR family transcriptional regulator
MKQKGSGGVLVRELSNYMPETMMKKPGTVAAEDTPFRSLIRTFGVLERVMQPYFAGFGLSGAQWGVLRQIHRAELEGHAGLRMTELSKRLLVRLPSATGVIDRLVRDGLVSRTALPEDLRVKQISLTEQGRKRVLKVLEVHDRQIAKVLSGLSEDEQKQMQRLLVRLREHLETMMDDRNGDVQTAIAE